ncbi:CAP domain-containing protein [Streptomyces sp. NPDC005438]|uniref:CAP domain-containing protein n=1 Tax=Streptomyces sp. NPDC005438 TaxID=3156880 RepID=UPI0033BB8931
MPVRTGLVGASAAVAMGAVAVASGLIPGPGGNYTVGSPQGPADRVRADRPSDLPSTAPSHQPTDDSRFGSGKNPDHSHKPKPHESSDHSPGRSPGSGDSSAPDGGDEAETPSSPPPSEDEPATGSPASADTETATEATVLSLVNQRRARAGCQPVTASPQLTELARDFSKSMASEDFFDHTSPDGKTPWQRAEEQGVKNLGGENIARGQADAEAVMRTWMKSPGHRQNILNCEHRSLGVGVHFGEGGPWWTQEFGF